VNKRAVSHGSTVDTAYARLRELVMDATLLPNYCYQTRPLSARLALDEVHLRLAATQLQIEGMLQLNHQSFSVVPLSTNDLESTLARVAMLEAEAVHTVAEQGVSSIGMAALDDAVRTMEDAFYRNDNNRWAAATHHFHRSLVQSCGQASLIRLALARSEVIHRARMVALSLHPPDFMTVDRHRALLTLIRSGAADQARDAHLEHCRYQREILLSLIDSNGMGKPR